MKDDIKLASIQRNYKKYCNFCGHTLTFFAFEPNKKLCSWCGRYNYRNEKAKFKDKLLKEKRKKECRLE